MISRDVAGLPLGGRSAAAQGEPASAKAREELAFYRFAGPVCGECRGPG